MVQSRDFAFRRWGNEAAQAHYLPVETVVAIAGAAVAALGLFVLTGWLLGDVWMVRVGAHAVIMKVNTAFTFVLAGGSLLLTARAKSPRRERAGQALAGIVAGIGLLSALEFLLHVNLGIDQLLYPDRLTPPTDLPGRMSLITALCFFLFGCGRVAAGYSHRYASAGYAATVLFGLFIVYVATLGYVYGAPVFYHPVAAASISVRTAVVFLVLFVSLMATRPHLGCVPLLLSPGSGGTMLRWILPVVIVLLPAIGWLTLQGEWAGMYDARIGLALVTSADVVVICTVLWFTARQADRLDNERQRAWVSLSASEQRLREQQLEIRELSTPVLQIRNRLLLLPIIGALDSERAKQLTNSLLQMIQDKRAKLVVMDITGVAAVDSRTANHLIETVTAAQLMGCAVIFTGLTADVAQSLVALGVDLGRLNTVGDLQGGLELAEQCLGACCDSGDEA